MLTDQTGKLSAEQLYRLNQIFNNKNWPKTDEFGFRIFDNYVDMLSNYNDKQRDLVLLLSERFTWIRNSEYMTRLNKALIDFVDNYSFGNYKKVVFCPLLKPKDENDPYKSSMCLMYYLKGCIDSVKDKYSDFDFKLASLPKNVNGKLINDENYTLCLIDDFIGTGDTAVTAVEYLKSLKIETDRLAFLSLACMKAGENRLKKLGYGVYTSEFFCRGMTDYGDAKKLGIMDEIESTLGRPSKYKYGYGRTEALLKLIRTPNNTFPIFWFSENSPYRAPFYRSFL